MPGMRLLLAMTALSLDVVAAPAHAGETGGLPFTTWPAADGGATLRAVTLSAGVVAAATAFGALVWYENQPYRGWHWRNVEGFGENTYAGGADKLAHLYAWYVGVRAMASLYQWGGLPFDTSLLVGGLFTVGLASTVEAVDGVTYGFEVSDWLANLLGIGLGLTLRAVPQLDAFVGLRVAWVPTEQFLREQSNRLKVSKNYSGTMFFLDLKPAGFEGALDVSIGPARFLSFGLTYNTIGYAPAAPTRQRNIGVYVGLNVAEFLDAAFGDRVGPLTTLAKYVAVPGATVALTRDLNHGILGVNLGAGQRTQIDIE
jgi:hypothetical protein